MTTTLHSSPYTDRVIGFAGPTPLTITLDSSNRITEILLLPNKETPSYQQIAVDAGLLNAWNGLTPTEALSKKVDAISGATFSSRGIIQTVHKRLEVYESQRTASATSTFVTVGGLLSVLLIATCLLVRFKRKQRVVN